MKKLLLFVLFSCVNSHADAMYSIDFKELYFFICDRLKNISIVYEDSKNHQNESIDNDADISSNEEDKKVLKKKKKIFKKKNIKKYLENEFEENCDKVILTTFSRKKRFRKKSEFTKKFKIFDSDIEHKLSNEYSFV